MTDDFYELLELREHWNNLHQLGDHAGVEKTLALSGLAGKDSAPQNLKKLLVGIPPEFQEKLLVFGREWEAKLVSLAIAEDFSIVRTTLSLVPEGLENLRRNLTERLSRPTPWGGVLFFENAGPESMVDGLWQAHAYFALAPGRNAEDLRLESLAGVKKVLKTESVMPSPA